MSDTLKGRVAIVTGAARGIGAAIAEALLQNGCKVCLADVLEQEGIATSKVLKAKYGEGSVSFRLTDVANQDSFEGCFRETNELWGPVTILVNNAGVEDEEKYQQCVDVNLVSSIRGAHLALKYMGKDRGGQGGNVVFTSSVLGLFPCCPIPAYCASKAGAVSLAGCFSHPEYNASGVQFATICPALTNTQMGQQFITKVYGKLEVHDTICPKELVGFSTPALIAGGVIQLLRDNRKGAVLLAHCGLEGHYRYLDDSHFDATAILAATKPANEDGTASH